MRKQLFTPIFLLVCLFNFSCKKDHSSEPGGTEPQKLYNVHFTTSGINKLTQGTGKDLTTNGLKTNTIDINSGYLKRLYYAVYDSKGVQLHTISQDSTAANFGSFTDKLPAGNYKVAIAAGMPGLTFAISTYYVPTIFYKDLLVTWPLDLAGQFPWKDTFYSNFPLTVGSTDINQDVTLGRIVAQLKVNIEDALPATAKKIVISKSEYELGALRFDTGILEPNGGLKKVNDITIIPGNAIGTTNFNISKNTLDTGKPFTITITCYDSLDPSAKILGQVILGNVTFQKNTITLLSGKLFGGSGSGNISLNSQWSVTPITIHF